MAAFGFLGSCISSHETASQLLFRFSRTFPRFASRSVTSPQKFAARGRGCVIRPELLNHKEHPLLSSPQFYFPLRSIRSNGDAKKKTKNKKETVGGIWLRGRMGKKKVEEWQRWCDERRKAILKERRVSAYF